MTKENHIPTVQSIADDIQKAEKDNSADEMNDAMARSDAAGLSSADELDELARRTGQSPGEELEKALDVAVTGHMEGESDEMDDDD